MEKEPRLWLFLPTEFENDPAFARSIQNVRSEKEPVPAIFQRFPVLMADRAFWVSLITTMHKKARNWGALRKLIQRHAPGHLKRDRALMVLACRHDASVFETLSILLQQDRECVEAMTHVGNTKSLLSFPKAIQPLFPDLLARGISNWPGAVIDTAEYIAHEMWQHLEVAEAWFQRGGRVHRRFSAAMKDNPAFGLLIAEHCSNRNDFIRGTSTRLRSNREFMIQAVALDGRTLVTASILIWGWLPWQDPTTNSYGGNLRHLTRPRISCSCTNYLSMWTRN